MSDLRFVPETKTLGTDVRGVLRLEERIETRGANWDSGLKQRKTHYVFLCSSTPVPIHVNGVLLWDNLNTVRIDNLYFDADQSKSQAADRSDSDLTMGARARGCGRGGTGERGSPA